MGIKQQAKTVVAIGGILAAALSGLGCSEKKEPAQDNTIDKEILKDVKEIKANTSSCRYEEITDTIAEVDKILERSDRISLWSTDNPEHKFEDKGKYTSIKGIKNTYIITDDKSWTEKDNNELIIGNAEGEARKYIKVGDNKDGYALFTKAFDSQDDPSNIQAIIDENELEKIIRDLEHENDILRYDQEELQRNYGDVTILLKETKSHKHKLKERKKELEKGLNDTKEMIAGNNVYINVLKNALDTYEEDRIITVEDNYSKLEVKDILKKNPKTLESLNKILETDIYIHTSKMEIGDGYMICGDAEGSSIYHELVKLKIEGCRDVQDSVIEASNTGRKIAVVIHDAPGYGGIITGISYDPKNPKKGDKIDCMIPVSEDDLTRIQDTILKY